MSFIDMAIEEGGIPGLVDATWEAISPAFWHYLCEDALVLRWWPEQTMTFRSPARVDGELNTWRVEAKSVEEAAVSLATVDPLWPGKVWFAGAEEDVRIIFAPRERLQRSGY